MKAFRYLLAGFAMTLGVLAPGVATASTTVGKVTFVGTIGEDNSNGAYSAQVRVRIYGTCDTTSAPTDRWILIRSGRMDGIFAHNSVNMRNAYSTLMAALLADKAVQIDGLPDCSTTSTIHMDLWAAQVGLF